MNVKKVSSQPLPDRAKECIQQSRRNAARSVHLGQALYADSHFFIADTMRSLALESSARLEFIQRLANASRFLLDMLQKSNKDVEAVYGKTDTLEQAAVELRALVEEHFSSYGGE